MHKYALIVITTLSIFGFQTPLALGMETDNYENSDRTIIELSNTGKRRSILLAEKKEPSPPKEKKEEPIPEKIEPVITQDSKTEDNSKSPKPKPKLLKPFVPSEKIQAEQAVDFPVDI